MTNELIFAIIIAILLAFIQLWHDKKTFWSRYNKGNPSNKESKSQEGEADFTASIGNMALNKILSMRLANKGEERDESYYIKNGEHMVKENSFVEVRKKALARFNSIPE